MKTIEYSSTGFASPDAHCEESALRFLQMEDKDSGKCCVSTENFISAVRALICEGKFPHNEVQFLFNGKIIPIDADGRIEEWPAGFCDTIDIFLVRLLTSRRQKKLTE